MANVITYGSLNVDTVLSVEEFALPGETIRAEGISSGPGGKGLNQAVAAARMGSATTMVGAIGTDHAGADLLERLGAEANLDLGRIRRVEGATGQAFVTVDARGENSIVIIPGANAAHTPQTATEDLDFMTRGDVLVCQLEIPTEAVRAGLGLARARGAYTILNAAPAADVGHLLADVDLLVVNETEADAIARGLGTPAPRNPKELVTLLHDRTGTDTVITLGGEGLVYSAATGGGHVPAFTVDVVDTTGAGDAFVGALSSALAGGEDLADALSLASALGALACTYAGAQGYRAAPERIRAMVRERAAGS